MVEEKIYVVGINDSTADMPGASFLPLGPYEPHETEAMDRAQSWIAEVYETSTGALTVSAESIDLARATANRYLRDEYVALRAASLIGAKEVWA